MMNEQSIDFMVLGAAKCGTTSLHNAFLEHKELCVPEKKDFRFFDDNKNFERGLNWYNSLFNCGLFKLKGEVSATYLYSNFALEKINLLYGNKLKFIVIIRNPADRAFSEYLHQKRYGNLDREFDFYLKTKPDDLYLTKEPPFDLIIRRGLYYKHLKRWIDSFGIEHFHIVQLENLKDNFQDTMKKLFDFLEVDSSFPIVVKKSNKSYTPRFKFLNKLILKQSIFSNTLKFLIPSFKVRQHLRNFIKTLNSSKSNQEKRLTTTKRNELINEFYKEDIIELENAFNLNTNYL